MVCEEEKRISDEHQKAINTEMEKRKAAKDESERIEKENKERKEKKKYRKWRKKLN